jgi:hypothetical protein
MYSVSAYFFAKVISEIPSSILTPVIFGSIVYFAIGLSTANEWSFPLFCKLNGLYNDFYSGYNDITLLRCWKLFTHY